jgi:hypothetical protein
VQLLLGFSAAGTRVSFTSETPSGFIALQDGLHAVADHPARRLTFAKTFAGFSSPEPIPGDLR